MGQKAARTEKFKQTHPRCCFCGGAKPTATIDHQPARGLFNNRAWPEGYEFPACDDCNQASKEHEHVWAFLVRISMDKGPPDAEFLKYARAMGNNFPGLLRKLSTNETRRFFKDEGLRRAPGQSFGEIAVAEIDPAVSTEILNSVLTKILKAIHYKYTGRIVPADALLRTFWFTNASMHQLRKTDLKGFVESLTEIPRITRNGTDLSDQFFFKFNFNPVELLSAAVLVFRQSIIAIGAIVEEPTDEQRVTWDSTN